MNIPYKELEEDPIAAATEELAAKARENQPRHDLAGHFPIDPNTMEWGWVDSFGRSKKSNMRTCLEDWGILHKSSFEK